MSLSLSHPLTQARYLVSIRSRLLSHYNRYISNQRGKALGKLSKAKAELRAVAYRMQGKPLPVKPVEYDLTATIGGVPVGVVIDSVTRGDRRCEDEVGFTIVTTKGYPLPKFIDDMVNDRELWNIEFDIWANLRAKRDEAELERMIERLSYED